MARSTPIQSSFNGGQISNKLTGRVDIDKYRSSCKELKNFLVTPEGPAVRRPGTKYVANALESDKKSRLEPFVFSNTQSYMLEFGDQKLRVFKDGAEVQGDSVTFADSDIYILKEVGGAGGGDESGLGDYVAAEYIAATDNSTETGENAESKKHRVLGPREYGTWAKWSSGETAGHVRLGVPFSFMDKTSTTTAKFPYRTIYPGRTGTSESSSNNRVDSSANRIVVHDHGYLTGDGPIQFSDGGDGSNLPGGISKDTDYYVSQHDGISFYIYTSYANSVSGDTTRAVDLTNSGEDSFTVTPDSARFRNVVPRAVKSDGTRVFLSGSSDLEDSWSTWSGLSGAIRGAAADTANLALIQSWIKKDDHGLGDKQGPFKLTISGGTSTFPKPLNATDTYYVVRVDKDTFCLSLTKGGQPVGLIDDGDGTIKMTPCNAAGTTTTKVEIETPYTSDEVFDIDIVQSADVMYIVHKDHLPHKLSRYSDYGWVLNSIHLDDGPYLDEGSVPGTISLTPWEELGAGVLCDIGCSEPIFDDSADSADYGSPGTEFEGWGRLLRVAENMSSMTADEDRTYRTIRITGVSDPFHARGVVVHPIPDARRAGSVDAWRLGAFRKGDFPKKVTLFQDRLVLAANPSAPETIYGSTASNYENFAPNTQTNIDTGPPVLASINDNNAWQYTLGGGFTGQVSEIQWLAPIRELIVGTSGGIQSVTTDSTGAVTPNNVFVRQNNVYGAASMAPLMVEDYVFYTSTTGRTVRGMGFNMDRDNYISEDLGVMARDILESGITQLAFAKEPTGMVYIVRKDGALVTLTLERSQQVAGFAVQQLGGDFGTFAGLDNDDDFDLSANTITLVSSGDHGYQTGDGPVEFTFTATSGGEPTTGIGVTPKLDGRYWWVIRNSATKIQLSETPGGAAIDLGDALGDFTATLRRVDPSGEGAASGPLVESVAVIPSTDETHSQVWLLVRRTSNTGVVVRHVEYFDAVFEETAPLDKARFLDSSVDKFSATRDRYATGLTHLEGKTVSVLSDGRYVGDFTVSSGQATIGLDDAGNRLVAGLAYTSTLKTNNFEIGDPEGSSQGKTRRITRVTARLHRSLGGQMGVSFATPRYQGAEGSSLSLIEYDPSDSTAYVGDPTAGLTTRGATAFTGDVRMPVNSSWGPQSVVEVSTSEPLPLTVVALIPEFSGSNR